MAYLKQLLFYTVVTVLTSAVCVTLCNKINLSDRLTLVLRAVICCILPNVIFLLVYRRTAAFKEAADMIRLMIKYTKKQD